MVRADHSYWGRVALLWAVEHAQLAGAELEVHVPSTDEHPGSRGIDSLANALARLAPAWSAVVRDTGSTSDALIRSSSHADLVVLGCRGRDHGLGLDAAVIPVASAAACDVLVVGGLAAAQQGGHTHRGVRVQLGTDADDRALRSGARLAALRRVPLHITLPTPVLSHHSMRPLAHHGRGLLLDATNLVRRIQPGLQVTTELLRSDPLDSATAAYESDVLVIGAGGQLGPTARPALYLARSPVLIARGT